jgi:hypothetical protein
MLRALSLLASAPHHHCTLHTVRPLQLFALNKTYTYALRPPQIECDFFYLFLGYSVGTMRIETYRLEEMQLHGHYLLCVVNKCLCRNHKIHYYDAGPLHGFRRLSAELRQIQQ